MGTEGIHSLVYLNLGVNRNMCVNKIHRILDKMTFSQLERSAACQRYIAVLTSLQRHGSETENINPYTPSGHFRDGDKPCGPGPDATESGVRPSSTLLD